MDKFNVRISISVSLFKFSPISLNCWCTYYCLTGLLANNPTYLQTFLYSCRYKLSTAHESFSLSTYISSSKKKIKQSQKNSFQRSKQKKIRKPSVSLFLHPSAAVEASKGQKPRRFSGATKENIANFTSRERGESLLLSAPPPSTCQIKKLCVYTRVYKTHPARCVYRVSARAIRTASSHVRHLSIVAVMACSDEKHQKRIFRELALKTL